MSKAVLANEGIAPTLLENPWYPGPADRVGFFGCNVDGGRIVRIGLIGQPHRKPPRTLMVDCPACGMDHQVKPTWRRSLEVDEGQEPELVIDLATIAGEDGDEDPDLP